MTSIESSRECWSEDSDPTGVAIWLSEIRPIMTAGQAEKEQEISSLIASLAVLKILAASKGDKNKFNLLSKQQLEAARLGLKLIHEVENDCF